MKKEMESDSQEKKMVKRVKEILHDRPEQEIYAMLKECAMNPDEAVQRLLSQDTFQEVKSKRDRKKEMREVQDSKTRSGCFGLNGGWNVDRDDVRTTMPSKSNAPVTTVHKKENDSVASSLSYSSSTIQAVPKTISQQSVHDSYSSNCENRGHSTGTSSSSTSLSQRPMNFGSSVAGAGTLSIADIVRGGLLHSGSLELTEKFPDHQDAKQDPDGYDGSESLTSVGYSSTSTRLLTPSDGLAVDCPGDRSHDQTTCNGEITCKKGSREDFHQANYPAELLPKQTTADADTVVLPSHLQAMAADCSHLSFGTYNNKSSTTGGLTVHNLQDELPIVSDRLLSQQLYRNDQFLTERPEPMSTQMKGQQMAGAAFRDEPISNIPDSISRDLRYSNHELMWEPGYSSSYRKGEVPSYSSEMGYSKAMQGNLLASSGQSLRTDPVQSMYLEDPDVTLRYNAAPASVKSSTFSLPETLTPDTFSPFEPSSWASFAGNGLAHQPLGQDYSQRTNLLKQYANFKGYQNILKEYVQVPQYQSAGSTKLDLPQYKRDNPSRNLTMVDYDRSAFGNIPSSNALRRDFAPNAAVASNLSGVGYNEMLQNQISKDGNHLLPHGLGDNGSIGWDYRAGAGALSAARESAYLNLLLEQERKFGHQQHRQYSQDYSSLGNLSSHRSQIGVTPDNSQLFQAFGDMALSDRPDTLSKQHQLWQLRRY